MRTRLRRSGVALVALLPLVFACKGLKIKDLDASSAASATSTLAPPLTPEATPCPRPIEGAAGIGYCRFGCRDLHSRRLSKHARRVASPSRYAFGTCGAYDVFAEVNGSDAGVTEYFAPDSGRLVGATDTLTPSCTQYGAVPSCTLALTWQKVTSGPTVRGAKLEIFDDDEEDAGPAPPPAKK